MLALKIGILMTLALSTKAFDEETKELARMVRESCIGETNVDISLLDKVNTGSDLTPDPVLKCYIKCTMETTGMMSDGNVDVDVVLTLLPEEMKNKHGAGLEACGTQKGVDDCDTAYLTQVCWQKTTKKDYFLV